MSIESMTYLCSIVATELQGDITEELGIVISIYLGAISISIGCESTFAGQRDIRRI